MSAYKLTDLEDPDEGHASKKQLWLKESQQRWTKGRIVSRAITIAFGLIIVVGFTVHYVRVSRDLSPQVLQSKTVNLFVL
jgi:hypothetical protein